MFVLKKLMTAFCVPPGIFVLILLLFAWRLKVRRQNRFALGMVVTALIIWGISTAPVSRTILSSLEKGLSIPENPRGDVIILLGGGINDKVPDLSGRGAPTGASLPRVVAAARLHKRLGIPIIVSGGPVFAGRTAEAVVLGRFLTDLGVPPDKVLLEDRSRDTVENALFTRNILNKYHFHTPLLITSAYHMLRSVVIFRNAGIEVIAVPTHFMTGGDAPIVWFDWLPDAGFMGGMALAMKEKLGMFVYRLTNPESK